MRLRLLLLLVWCGCGSIPVVFPEDAGTHMCSPTTCAAPLVCEVSGECVECTTNTQCTGATPACDAASKRCVPCQGTVGCTAPYVCSPSAALCVLPCTGMGGNECPGFIDMCRSNVCSACNDDEDCASGMLCDKRLGRCVGCLSDMNCAGATPKCHQTTGLCEACIHSTDCASGGCFRGTCR